MVKKGENILELSLLGQSATGFHSLAYTAWGQRGTTPPVICVHGLTRNGRDFDRLATSLATTRQVFCPDIAGRGRSDDLADPSLYGYPQYCADMTALIARIDAPKVDWIGTSMGGIIGMLLAAQPKTPIHRLVLNDVGPWIPLPALKRIGDYVGQAPEFDDLAAVEQHMRTLYAPFGITAASDWKAMATNGVRRRPNGKLVLAYDPRIANNFAALDRDVDLWSIYDRIRCPVLVLRGASSDILPRAVADDMTQRGPRASLVDIEGVGHAPALLTTHQIALIQAFLSG